MHEYAHIVMLIFILVLLRKTYAKRVIWFYRPDCGHCQKMHPEWDKFESSAVFTVFPPIEAKKININEPQNATMAENYEVQGVPFIVKLDNDGVRNIYNGSRTSEDIFRWAYA